MSIEGIFYTTGILCAYSYFFYPLILKLIPARKAFEFISLADAALPKLSLIVTAHNEALRIRDKLENTLDIDYPADLLETIVASDFSTDSTDSIVESYADKGIRLVRSDERKGKEYAQLCAIRQSNGEILVFSDVATQIPTEAFRLLANRFSDERIGAVSSQDQFISNDGELVGEGAYVQYEMWLRRLESNCSGLVGLSGSFFAARRKVCEQWDIYSPSDFNTGLNCAKQGLVAVTCSDVIGIYKDVKDPGLEYRRKVRTVIRGMTAVARHPEVLNPFKMGLFAFQVWSHKIMRWGVPWFMLLFGSLTVVLQGNGWIYTLALITQVAFYTIALAGKFFEKLRRYTFVRITYFFVQTNIALAQAALFFLLGKRMTIWTPSQR
jgi:glycosyltransferase involved in cell wall biosynthesis